MYARILLGLSILPVFLIILFMYNKDKDKEPTGLLVKLFIGGVGSCILVMIISGLLKCIFPFFALDFKNMNLLQLIIYAFIYVALVEEFCKWIMAYKISYNHKEFDQFYDMILYCVIVALGFACFENIFYVFSGGISTGIARAFSAVPGHAADGVMMGYYLGLAKIGSLNGRKDLKNKYMALSIIAPTFFHGFYDYCLFTGRVIFVYIFYIFVICFFIHVFKKVNKISSINGNIIKKRYCTSCGHEVNSNFCPRCGKQCN